MLVFSVVDLMFLHKLLNLQTPVIFLNLFYTYILLYMLTIYFTLSTLQTLANKYQQKLCWLFPRFCYALLDYTAVPHEKMKIFNLFCSPVVAFTLVAIKSLLFTYKQMYSTNVRYVSAATVFFALRQVFHYKPIKYINESRINTHNSVI